MEKEMVICRWCGRIKKDGNWFKKKRNQSLSEKLKVEVCPSCKKNPE